MPGIEEQRKIWNEKFKRRYARMKSDPDFIRKNRLKATKYMIGNPEASYKKYRWNAIDRGIVFAVSLGEFLKLWKVDCWYCGDKIVGTGIDRLDNEKGYVNGNLVSCCKVCNFMKRNLPIGIFVEHCKKVAKKFEGEDSFTLTLPN